MNISKALNNIKDLNSKIFDSLGYKFKNESLLLEAMMHASLKNETNADIDFDNQKLEFLGDAVLDLAVSKYLYAIKKYSEDEGTLTKNRAALVREESFAKFARKLQLNECLIMSEASQKNKIQEHDSVLADAFEALFGAIFLDSDFDNAYKILIENFEIYFKNILEDEFDFKSELNEECAKRKLGSPNYHLDSVEGPEHDRDFFCTVFINDKKIGEGSGKSIKAAQKMAAAKALGVLKKNV